MSLRILLGLTVATLVALLLGAGPLPGTPREHPAPATPRPSLPPAALNALFSSHLPDQHGEIQPLEQWRGKTLLINFWASWCPPCREEIPDLARLHRARTANSPQIIGISVDLADKSQTIALAAGADYPLLLGGEAGIDLLRALGNPAMALPYTLVIDPQGKIIFQQAGRLPPELLAAAWRAGSAP